MRTQPQRLADDAASVYLSISCGSSYKGLLVNTVIKALEGCKVVIYQVLDVYLLLPSRQHCPLLLLLGNLCYNICVVSLII